VILLLNSINNKRKGWDRRDWSRETEQLISMTWPVILELLLTGVINTGSQYYLNAYSSDAVAVEGSLSQVVSFAGNLYTLISVGGSILLAPMIGAAKARESGILIRTMLLCNLILAGVVSACTLALSGTFMHMMGIEPALRDLGQQYLTVNFGLSFVRAMMVTYSAVFRSIFRIGLIVGFGLTLLVIPSSLCSILNAYLLGIRLGLGLSGIWLGYIADLLLRGLAETAVFYRRTTEDAIRRERLMGKGDIVPQRMIRMGLVLGAFLLDVLVSDRKTNPARSLSPP